MRVQPCNPATLQPCNPTFMNREQAESCTILRAEVGSVAHGISIGSDDRDEMGVCIEPLADLLADFEQFIHRDAAVREGDHNAPSQPGDLDLTIYSLRKFVRLAMKGNPSILTLLFATPLHSNKWGDGLRALPFASKRAGSAFLGYMQAQRHRLLCERGGKHGHRDKFDLKYAAHVLRLGYQGAEYMEGGAISVPLPEEKAKEIQSVRRGEFDQSIVLQKIGDAERLLKDAVGLSELPETPDEPLIKAWVVEAYRQNL